MTIALRRAWAVLLVGGLVASATVLSAPAAQAAPTCVNVPGSTPGLNLSIGGQPQRVPGVSEVSVCADTGYVPLVSVTLDGRGHCTWGCFSVVAQGGSVKPPALTINYKLDGVLSSTTVGGGTGGPGTETCLLSVGGRYAPYPTCQGFGLGIDQDDPTQGVLETVQNQIEWAEATVDDTVENLDETVEQLQSDLIETVNGLGDDVEYWQEYVLGWGQVACDAIPPQYGWEGWYWREVRFCDDPVAWTTIVATNAESTACDTVPPAYDDWNTYYFCEDPVGWLGALEGGATDRVVEQVRECLKDDSCIIEDGSLVDALIDYARDCLASDEACPALDDLVIFDTVCNAIEQLTASIECNNISWRDTDS